MDASPKIRRGWGALVILGVAACSGAGFDDAVPADDRDEPSVEVSAPAPTQESVPSPAPASTPSTPPSAPAEAGAPSPADAGPPPGPGFPGPFDGGWLPPIDLDSGFIPTLDGGPKPPPKPKKDGGIVPNLDGGFGLFDGGLLPF